MASLTTAKGLRYPAGTTGVPPDVVGDIRNLAQDVDPQLATVGGWLPAFGGGAGAALGANSVTDGQYTLVGKSLQLRGRILFGSSASFGAGTATISGFPNGLTIDQFHNTGYGYYQSGSTYVPCAFTYLDGANMAIRPHISGGSGSTSTLGAGFNIGTPTQSSVLIFTFDLTVA